MTGGNLQELIENHGGKEENLKTYMALFEQMVEGILEIHSKGQMHRDIKPENVFLRKGGENLSSLIVKLGDFGLARDMSSTKGEASSYSKGVGTNMYQSPELMNDEPYGPANDIWALGIVLYEMLTGVHPFDTRMNIL